MDKAFFGLQIDKLRGVYSAAAMNEHRVQLFWDRFKGVENRVFENAVNWLIAEATSQQLPAMSRFVEAMGLFRTNPNGTRFAELPDYCLCSACKDHGFGFVGDIVVACSCATGRGISPEGLARHQRSYNVGREKFPTAQAMLRAFGGGA